jgi:hypothetical protein
LIQISSQDNTILANFSEATNFIKLLGEEGGGEREEGEQEESERRKARRGSRFDLNW